MLHSLRWRQGVLLTTLCASSALVATFAATEWFIARKRQTTLIYEPNLQYRHALVPNQTYIRDGFTYVVGPHRLRGRQPELPKPEGLTRVVVLGGSSVFDFRVKTSWPEGVEARLRARGLQHVEVFNGGIPGFSTQEIAPFYELEIRRYQPDFVLLYVGWNDLKYMVPSKRELTLRPWPKKANGPPPVYDFLLAPRPLRNWYALPIMLEKAQGRLVVRETNEPTAGAKAPGVLAPSTVAEPSSAVNVDWKSTPGMRFFAANFDRIAEAIAHDGATLVLVREATLAAKNAGPQDRERVGVEYAKTDYATLLSVSQALDDLLAEIAETRSLTVIDPRAQMDGRSEYFHDHVHLTTAGSTKLADLVTDGLMPLLERSEEP